MKEYILWALSGVGIAAIFTAVVIIFFSTVFWIKDVGEAIIKISEHFDKKEKD